MQNTPILVHGSVFRNKRIIYSKQAMWGSNEDPRAKLGGQSPRLRVGDGTDGEKLGGQGPQLDFHRLLLS
jgi:hypothetical protein